MMGKRSDQESLFSYQVNLAQRIPGSHPLKQIRQMIDFSFVREVVSDRYGQNGHVSEDPEVILKLMFLLFFDNLASERELMRQLPYRLDYLWFLGFTLDDRVPDHSILSKARRRWGREVFESLFVRTVRQCVAAGLVEGSKLHFDGSLIAANASPDSVVEGPPELIAALRAAYQATASRLDEPEEEEENAGDDDSDPDPPRGGYQKKNSRLLSTTDPDAPVIRRKGLASRPRYKTHRAVDNREGVITALATTPGDVEENRLLPALLAASEAHTGIAVATAVADAQYGTADNFRELQRRGIHTHMADLGLQQTRETGLFTDREFVYDAAADCYFCPAGQRLTKRHFKPIRQTFYYGGRAKLCRSCELRASCTRSQHGRTVMRHVDHELVEAGRKESASAAARRDRRRRRHLAEGSFAEGANFHGLKRSRWRGLVFQQIQDWLIAACQNIKKLIHRTSGPELKATALALAQAPESGFGLVLRRFQRIFDPIRRILSSWLDQEGFHHWIAIGPVS